MDMKSITSTLREAKGSYQGIVRPCVERNRDVSRPKQMSNIPMNSSA